MTNGTIFEQKYIQFKTKPGTAAKNNATLGPPARNQICALCDAGALLYHWATESVVGSERQIHVYIEMDDVIDR